MATLSNIVTEISADGVIERDMTASEISQLEIDNAEAVARASEAETKAAARQAVLDRLGLTEEEAQLIIGGSN